MQKVEGSNPFSRSPENPAFEAVAQTPLRRGLSSGGPLRIPVVVGDGGAVAQNFLECDREQELLLPPSLREWLAEDHLAWFVLDAVEAIDLRAFYAELPRATDGAGRRTIRR